MNVHNTLFARPASASPANLPERSALFVVFQIAHQQYGMALETVIEVVRLPALVSLAGASPALCGLLNLRGQYVPVLDGRALVGEPSVYDLSSQIVIAGRSKPELGLLVDQVHDVHAIAASQVMPIDRRDVAAFLTGVFDREDRSVLLFDLPALLALTPAPASSEAKAKPKTKGRAPRSA